METNQKKKSFVGTLWLAGAIVAAVVLLFIHGYSDLYTLIISVKDYSPMHGVLSSPFVGMRNFATMFSSAVFPSVLGNTYVLGIITALFTVLIVTLAVWGLSNIKKTWLRYTLAGVTFMPLAMTQVMLLAVPALHSVIRYENSLVRLLMAFYQAVIIAPYLIVVLLILVQSSRMTLGRMLAISAIVALGAGFYAGVCGSLNLRQMFSSPINYEVTDTLNTYSFRAGMMQAQYPVGAASSILNGIIGKAGIFLPLLAVIFLLPSPKSKTMSLEEKPQILSLIALPSLLIALVVFFVGLASFADADNVDMMGALLPTVLQIINPLLGVILGFLIAGIIVRGSVFSKIWVALVVLLLLPAGSFSMGEYLSARTFGTLNTLIPRFDLRMTVLLAGTMVGFLFWNNYKRSATQAIFAALSAYLLSFLTIYADPSSPMIYIMDMSKAPLSLLQRQIIASGASPASLMGVISVIIPLIALVGGILLLILATKEDETQAA